MLVNGGIYWHNLMICLGVVHTNESLEKRKENIQKEKQKKTTKNNKK